MPPKRRRRFQGLYYHSSPPKVLPMNGQIANSNGRRTRGPDDLSVKLSTIRIWMHEKDIGKLTRVLWAGQGNRLRQQASTNAKVKRFLAAVPYVMNSIKDVHQAVIDNSLENLQANLEPPVPPALVTCRDANGLNLIHKAAGLGHATILEYLITTWPDGVHETDITGKTPLHWAASAKNNMRCYTLLTQAGCDEEAVDYKMKTPSFYRHKPHEIERAFLTYVPEAPRVSPDVATDWEALSDDSGDGKKPDIKIPEMNGFGRHSNAESNENETTSEAEMAEEASAHEDDDTAEESPEPSAEIEQIEENPEDEEEAEHEENADEVTKTQNNASQEKDEEETEEKQDKEESEAENEDMLNDKEEPLDEKQQTQTITEAAENLTKDSSQKDEIATNNVESNELEYTNDKATSDTMSEKDQEDDPKVIEKVDQSSNALDGQNVQDNKEVVKDESEEKTADQINEQNVTDDLESTINAADNKKDLKENELDANKNEALAIENVKVEESKIDANETEQNQTDNDLQMSKEEEHVESTNQDDAKTLTETLIDIKDEVKDNVKHLADQVKNVFSDKDQTEEPLNEANDLVLEDKTELNDNDNNKGKDEKGASNEATTDKEDHQEELKRENLSGSLQKSEVANGEETQENNIAIETQTDQNENHKANDEQTEENEYHKANEAQTDQHENHKANEAQTEQYENHNVNAAQKDQYGGNDKPENEWGNESLEQQAPTSSSGADEIEATKTQTHTNSNIPTNSHLLSHSSNENFPFNTQTPHPAAPKSPTKASPKKENEKTEEDENNNNSKLTNELTTINDDKTSAMETSAYEQLQDTNESLKENERADENIVEETDISEKLKEMGDSLKESVANMADKVKNVFADKDEPNKLDTESNDVVLHTESPVQQNSAKKSVKEVESSDDTNDEDEEPKIEAENEEYNETDGEEIVENKTEPEQADEHELETRAESEDIKNDEEIQAKEDKPNEMERDGEGSTTSSLAIEGFVQGDAEDNTVQSETAAYVDDDEETRLQNIIASGDMEQLAQIVLNGDGKKLLNVKATEPEIQAFLKNVPNYMNKIRRVHEAARSGSLLNLQQALDRRKFAIAKDEISPNGATPLHVAVLFGNSDIVRYLSARFPETTTITDNEERTALHYAAVINDNGHFYNVLLQLGANPKAVDSVGYSSEDYLNKEELSGILSYSELLKRFGAEDLEEQLLSDQGRIEAQSIQENPLFKTEQGKYLADNLADPLIKALTQVAQKRPNDPLQYLANYLQSYITSRNTNGRTITHAAIHSGSSKTNSTVLASPKQHQTEHMNGQADNIESESVPQIDGLDEDDGNDSDAAMSRRLEERDEHGQSMLHFACARSHRKGGLIHLIEDAKADITYRDELYRTAKDVALQANQENNSKEIDRYVMSLAIVGDIKPFEHFALSGYDHILDVVDDNKMPIIEVVEARGLHELAAYLKTIRPLEELREELHQMIRDNNVGRVKEIADGPSGRWLIKAKNYYGRTALHIAILKESVEIVEHFVNICPEALKIGDNLERTALHYAMGTNIIESISRILIQNGAKRTSKDLKGRQPSYYFMNKADILRLQEEEDENR